MLCVRNTFTPSEADIARGTPQLTGGAGQDGIPPGARRPARQVGPCALPCAAALAGIAAIATYLVIALSRLTYPFPLEWLESNSLIEVHRILAGRQLYPAPTIGYVPDGYPPLYFAVSAMVARVAGVSYLSDR